MDGDMNERAAEHLAQCAALAGISADELAEVLDIFITNIRAAFNLDEILEWIDAAIRVITGGIADAIEKLVDAVGKLNLSPPLSKLARKWLADRRRADRERERVKIKVFFERAARRVYKPP